MVANGHLLHDVVPIMTADFQSFGAAMTQSAIAAETDFKAAALYGAIAGLAGAAASAIPNEGRGYGGGARGGYGRAYSRGQGTGYGSGGEVGGAPVSVGSLAPGSAPSRRVAGSSQPILVLVTEEEANRWVSERVNAANNSGIPMTVQRSALGSYAQG